MLSDTDQVSVSKWIFQAGILTYAEGESVEKTLRPMIYSAPLANVEPTVQKFRDYTHPRLETHRVHYGHANDPKDYEWITHGLKSDDKSGVRHSLTACRCGLT